MNRFQSYLCVCLIAAMIGPAAEAQAQLPSGQDPHPEDGVAFVLKAFDRSPVVAVADLPGCEALHRFLRRLIQAPEFRQKTRSIVVDFGNSIFQPVIDRYVLNGELVPADVLRHVWDDTTESPNLTWDSPVYTQFFDAVRTINLTLPKEGRIRVVLADAPILWRKVQTRDQWLAFAGQAREEALAEKVNELLNQHQSALVISARPHLLRTSSATPMNARALVENAHPHQILVVVPQSRFGGRDLYKQIEARQSTWRAESITMLQENWLGLVPLSSEPNSPRLQDVAEAVLYLGETKRFTRVHPSADLFRNSEFWGELNRRWTMVHTQPFDLLKAGFDLRGPLYPNAPRTPDVLPPSPHAGIEPVNAVDFVLKKLDEYPLVGIGDIHMSEEFYRFLGQLVTDPRLPGKIQDIVVEAGNPRYQALLDRYLLGGEPLSLAERKPIWQEAAMGWYEANSPVYEQFYDTVRRVNSGLPRDMRFRIILGDAAIDIRQFRENPEAYLRQFSEHRETIRDPREMALAAAIEQVLNAGRRAIVIWGNGHLRLTGRPGNARHIFEPRHPGQFYLIDQNGPAYAGWPSPSVVVRESDPEPRHATLWLGPFDAQTLVRPNPLLYRDPDYWSLINLMEEVVHRRFPLDLADPVFGYRGRYFEER